MAFTVEEFEEYLVEVVQRMEQPEASEPLTRWTEELSGDLGEGFLGSRSPDGQAWRPLKKKRSGKSRRGGSRNPGRRPLIDTGDLMLSVISDGRGHVETITGDEVIFGTEDELARIHQDGRGPIPERPFIGVSEEMENRALEIVADFLIERMDF